jgi:hypothetical protein
MSLLPPVPSADLHVHLGGGREVPLGLTRNAIQGGLLTPEDAAVAATRLEGASTP